MNKCSVKVSRDAWHSSRCERNAVIERDGKSYCKQHDPEYIKAKDAQREEKYRANNCQGCNHHFYHDYYRYCPICGLKRVKVNK